jgi:hypothetical protein
MSQADPIADLVQLTRAAADAGEDWRGRLRRDWLPALVASRSPAELEASLSEWQGPHVDSGGSLTDAIESAVTEALAEIGYS